MADPGETVPADGDGADWPVELRGVTESVVATHGPNDRWNLAALGVHAPDADTGVVDGAVGARTWGRTRTRGNFRRRGEGVVQFVDDPVTFVEAALDIVELPEPVHDAAAAWVRVDAEAVARGADAGTEWVDWRLRPKASETRRRTVPTIRRGSGAVIEASVWASRLDAAGYDADELRARVAFLGDVVESAGDARDRAAFERLRELADGLSDPDGKTGE